MNKKTIILSVCSILLLAGCSMSLTTPKKEKIEPKLSEDDYKKYKTFKVSKSLKQTNKLFIEALDAKANKYAPKKIEEASKLFDSINKNVINKVDKKIIFLKVKKINKLIKEAYEVQLKIVEEYTEIFNKIKELKTTFDIRYKTKLLQIEKRLESDLLKIELYGYVESNRDSIYVNLKDLYSKFILEKEYMVYKNKINLIKEKENYKYSQECSVLPELYNSTELQIKLTPSDLTVKEELKKELESSIKKCNFILDNIYILDNMKKENLEGYILENVLNEKKLKNK